MYYAACNLLDCASLLTAVCSRSTAQYDDIKRAGHEVDRAGSWIRYNLKKLKQAAVIGETTGGGLRR